jgi:hypothetical protein
MKYLMILFTLLTACSSRPEPDVSKFNPSLLTALQGLVYKVGNLPNQMTGTGFMISVGSKTFMVTNAHICKGMMGQPTLLAIGNQQQGNAAYVGIIAVDAANDLCITSGPFLIGPMGARAYATVPTITVQFGFDDESDGRTFGATYVTAGHPNGGSFDYQSFVDLGDEKLTLNNDSPYCQLMTSQDRWYHKVSPKYCQEERNEMLLSEACMHGQSGSPIINQDGQLVGVLQATNFDRNVCYAVQIPHLIHLLREVLAHE